MYVTRHIIVYPSVRLISYCSSYGTDFSTLQKNAFTTSGNHTFSDDDDDNY